MHETFFYDQLQSLFEHIFSRQHSAGLILKDGTPIFIKYQNLPDIGTLPLSAQQCSKYLNLHDGDIVLTNDPYSGGTILSTMTLLGCVDLSLIDKSFPMVFLTTRLTFKPELQLSNTVEEEGVRIPPTPIFQNNLFNSEIVKAIAAHPQCPSGFNERVLSSCSDLQETMKRLTHSIKSFSLDFSLKTLNRFCDHTHKIFIEMLSDLPKGEVKKSFEYEHNSKLKLKLNVQMNTVEFDFTGSGKSESLNLTDAATFGACMGALMAAVKNPVPLNHGVFRIIKLIAPKGTMVNASYPTATYHGMTDGAPLVANSVIQCLLQLSNDKETRMADSGVTQCSINIDFNDGLQFFDTLESGTGALNKFPGRDALNLWRRSELEPSVEQIEKRYPLQIKSFSYRARSGGRGLFEGGHGVSKVYQLKAPGKLKWLISQDAHAPIGIEGGKHGAGAQIYIQKKGSLKDKEILSTSGEVDLSTDDVLVVLSPGGGATEK